MIKNDLNTASAENLPEEMKKKLKDAIKEMSDSYLRIEAERELQKQILDTISDEIGVDKKIIRKMARTYHKQDFDLVREEHETFEASYESVFGRGL